MPDFGAPIAQDVNVSPQRGIQTLSDLMGLQQRQIAISQAQQNLQTGQAMQQTAQAEAQKNQQAMNERQWLQNAQKTGKDELGNQIIDPTTGEPNTPAFAAAITRNMPTTGQPVIQNIIKTQDDRLKLGDTVRQLGQNYRNDLAGIVRSSIGTDDDTAAKIDAYVQQQGPQAPPGLAEAAAHAKSLLQNLGPQVQDDHRDKALLHLSQQFEPTSSVEAEQRPAISSVTGQHGGFQPVQTNPLSPIPMGPVGSEVRTGVGPQIVMDLQGQPHFIGGAAGTGGGPSGQPFPTPQQVQTQTQTGKEMADHFSALNASAQSLPLVTGLTKTIEGLAPEAFTGPGGDKRQYMAGLARSLGINLTGDAQTDTNLLNKAIAQLNISTPAGTDAARALIEAGQPNSKMDPEAIKTAAGTIRGQVLMNQAERNFLQTTRLSNRGAGDPQAYQEGRQAFEANADPRIWQYEDLSKSDPKAAARFIAKQPDRADLVRKATALESMGFFRR